MPRPSRSRAAAGRGAGALPTARPGRLSAPALLLAAALSLACLLASDPDRHIDLGIDYTWQHMAVAENLAPRHRFLGFYRQWLDGAGVTYEPYNRFPVLGHALIKLVTLPFPDDAAARIRAARTLMLGFFAAAAALGWLALRRLIDDDWIALATVLLAFSSVQAMRYADMVSPEGVVDLFAVMLALHGAAVFATCGRFGQFVAKVCAALLLGWHVFALVGPLAVLGLGAALWRRDWGGARRHFALGAVAVLFGAGVLGFNLAREHVALGGETPFAQLPSLDSALRRLGIAPRDALDWPRFPGQQLHRLALASAPYPVGHFALGENAGHASLTPAAGWNQWRPGAAAAGGLVLLTTLALAASSRHRRQTKLTLAALAAAGPVWLLGLRHQAEHVHESLFLIGTPLALFALTLPAIGGGRTRAVVVVAAALAFAGGPLLLAASGGSGRDREVQALAADIDAIRPLVAGRAVLPATNYNYGADNYAVLLHFLHGARATADVGLAEVVLRREPLGLGDSLTPGNKVYFLYARHAWEAAHRRYERLAANAPPDAAAGDYRVHLVAASVGDELLVVRRNCPFAAGLPFGPGYGKRRPLARVGVIWQEPASFFAHVHPVDAKALPASRQSIGFARVPFPRGQWAWRSGGDCLSVRALPGYPIASITVGQFRRIGQAPGYQNVWTETIAPTAATQAGPGAPTAG